jgi:hypothetical protein
MGSTRNRRRSRNQHPATRPGAKKPQEKKLAGTGLFSRTGAWLAGVAAVVLATALGSWLTDWGKSFTASSASGPAFYASVNVDRGSTDYYVLASPVTSAADRVTLLSGTASDADVMALIARHGGVPVHQLTVTVILTGNRSSLRIVDITPNMMATRAAPAAAYLAFPTGGAVGVTSVNVNLDRPLPVLYKGSSPYFDSNEIDLVRGERYSFRMTFETGTGYHEFNLIVTYIYAGKQYEQTIPGSTHGLFQVIGPAADYHDYRIIYFGINPNQFEVASKTQSCILFPHSGGC